VCLILFAWQAHSEYPLVLAANRDEFHQRPTAEADFWDDAPDILAGRDLQAGGTWLGVNRGGRFAAITNYREPSGPGIAKGRSRGRLVRNFLAGRKSPLEHAEGLRDQAAEYQGFNLLMGNRDSLAYVSNRDESVIAVESGVHGLSNHLLDTNWPKVEAGRDHLQDILRSGEIEPESLFDLLSDRSLTPGKIPQDIEKHLAPERMMKHYFIVSDVYGTRSSSVLLLRRDGSIYFSERQYNARGQATDTRRFLI
jgi:uncharacterized protein with NRDE domain